MIIVFLSRLKRDRIVRNAAESSRCRIQACTGTATRRGTNAKTSASARKKADVRTFGLRCFPGAPRHGPWPGHDPAMDDSAMAWLRADLQYPTKYIVHRPQRSREGIASQARSCCRRRRRVGAAEAFARATDDSRHECRDAGSTM